MSVPGLWQILLPAAQMRSLTQVATVKGFERDHHGLRTIILGIDASIWMKKSQAKFYHPQHAQAGENPELRVLFYCLCYLLRHPITPIFIFDGPARPAIKRNTNVIAQAHWLTQQFQEFISMFGFHLHMKPKPNWRTSTANMIDAVMTDDGDALIFGATYNLFVSLNIKKDGDAVTIFTKTAVQTTQDVCLTEGGMLLIALLSGGDYDTVSSLSSQACFTY
ncbi:PIN domain-like protein [Tricholoma matsutake]|nr:PIN domain-like protein [Tricholoma matsutake 945]